MRCMKSIYSSDSVRSGSSSSSSSASQKLLRQSSFVVPSTIALVAVISLLILSGARAQAEADALASVEVVIDVPHPGWKIQIESMHTKAGKLLVVCRARSAEGMHASMISKAKDSKMLYKKLAALPREIYLLDRDWNWSKGYTAVNTDQLKKVLQGSKSVYLAKVDEKGEDQKNDGESPASPTAELDVKRLVGMPVELAQALAKKHKLPSRVVSVDGKSGIVTLDHRPERLNFTVVKGKVTKVTKG